MTYVFFRGFFYHFLSFHSIFIHRLSQESKTETTSLYGQAPVPTSSMKIYHQGTQKEIIADNVKIGDRLTLSISIEQQDIYGMKITNCLVRDGLNWGEQPLINDEGLVNFLFILF